MAIKNYNVYDSSLDENLKKVSKILKEISGDENKYFTVEDSSISSGSTITCKINNKEFLKFENAESKLKISLTGAADTPTIIQGSNNVVVNNIYSTEYGIGISFNNKTTETPINMIITKDETENENNVVVIIGKTSSNLSTTTASSSYIVFTPETDNADFASYTPVVGRTIQLLPFQTSTTSIHYTPHAFWLPYTDTAEKNANKIITLNNKDYLTNYTIALEI